MSLVRYNSNEFRPVSFNGLIDRFFNDRFFSSEEGSFSPKVDVVETARNFELEFSIPGLHKKDIKIDVNDGRLEVSGERKLEKENKDRNYRFRESHYGIFRRVFQLPDNANTEKVEASYKDGVLTVIVPKDEKKGLVKTIEIK